MVASWFETTFPTLLSNYKPEDIFNADEFVLFYQCLPNKTLHLKSEKCSGGKNSKIRITGLAAANSVGDKLPMFAIGKSKAPTASKMSHLYHANTDLRRKAGWIALFLKNGFVS